MLVVGNSLGGVYILPKDSTSPTKYQLHYKPIRGICFADEGSKLLTCSDDYSVRIFDINAESPIAELNGHKNAVTSIHWNAVDKTIVTGGLDKLVKIWDIRAKSSVGTIGYHSAPVWAVKFSNNGKVVASGGESGILAIHSIK